MYKKGYFFRDAAPSSAYTNHGNEFCVQIPSLNDLAHMHGMPAGLNEDQYHRLTNMTRVLERIKKEHPQLPVMNTDQAALPMDWQPLFSEIEQGTETKALGLFNKISARDPIKQALLSVHSFDYVQQLIRDSILARTEGRLNLETEITITPGTFVALVKDLALTLLHSAKVHFAFGLPTHHASSLGGSGFCILDKTAMLIKYKAQHSNGPLRFVLVGTDINRDNGLSRDLMEFAAELNICHIDIFDSRVYPGQNHDDINLEFDLMGQDAGQNIKCWQRQHMQYFAVDLSQTPRGMSPIHAALGFAVDKIKAQLVQAQKEQQKIMLVLPTGWDSHQQETAACGKWVNGQIMKKEEAAQTRFSDDDLSGFYTQIFALYQEHKEHIAGIYWGLEGGYNRAMYEQQIKLLMSLFLDKLVLQNLNESSYGYGR